MRTTKGKHCGNSLEYCDAELAKRLKLEEMGCRCACEICKSNDPDLLPPTPPDRVKE